MIAEAAGFVSLEGGRLVCNSEGAGDAEFDSIVERVERAAASEGGVESICSALEWGWESQWGSGGWVVSLGYGLGRLLEPAATRRVRCEDEWQWPEADLAWCPTRAVIDHEAGRTYFVGPEAERLACMIEEAEEQAAEGEAEGYTLGRWEAEQRRAEVESAVARTVEYICAGDVFQANVAQRFRARFSGSARALFGAGMERGQPWYGALLELPGDRRVISLSPELLINGTRGGEAVTRPIKGTLPAGARANDLAGSVKDAAELTMIVDLMRNDLGRVCRAGSVHVERARDIETHPTVHHGVATIGGALRHDLSARELLTAIFPGGSVTGAPKIRAMQIIEELEPARRGPYCGSIGWWGTDGSITLSVAIRTIAIRGQDARYWAGAGIVSDSKPVAEYEEMLTKRAVADRLCCESERVVIEQKDTCPTRA